MKGMKSSIKWVLAALMCSSHFFHIQAQSEDFGTRYAIAVSGGIVKKLTWNLEFEERLNNNSTSQDRTLAQASLKYELFDKIKIGTGYRMTYVYQEVQNNTLKHRYYIDLSYTDKLARFRPSYRCRWQYGGEDIFTQSEAKQVLRQRIKVGYKPFGLPISPYVAAESFTELNSTHQGLIQAYRYSIGMEVKISSSLALDCTYLRDKEMNMANPATINALSLALAYQF